MPVFSALSEEVDVPYVSDSYDQGAPEDESAPIEIAESEGSPAPFPQGGAEPPDTSSVDNVFKALIDDLSVNDAMLSGVVSKTFNWKLDGDRITACIGSQFELMQMLFLSRVSKSFFQIGIKIHGIFISSGNPVAMLYWL